MTSNHPVPLIPENAPFSSAQRAWLNGFLAGLFSQARIEDRHRTPHKKVTIYFGSETGNAEAFAKRAAKAAVQRGFETAAICMDKANLGLLERQASRRYRERPILPSVLFAIRFATDGAKASARPFWRIGRRSEAPFPFSLATRRIFAYPAIRPAQS